MFLEARTDKTDMRREERAIIHMLNVSGEEVTVSKFYGTTVAVTAGSVKLRTKTKFSLGANVEIILHVEGHRQAFNLSGVIFGVEEDRVEKKGYLVHIRLNQKNNDRDDVEWRRMFH
jgi:hypothetical protein